MRDHSYPEIADGGITVESAACFPPAFSRQPGLCLTAAPSSPLRAVVLPLHLLALSRSAVSRVGHTRPARGCPPRIPRGFQRHRQENDSAIASQCDLVQIYSCDVVVVVVLLGPNLSEKVCAARTRISPFCRAASKLLIGLQGSAVVSDSLSLR